MADFERTMVVSTGHLSLQTRNALAASEVKVSMMSWEYGWTVWAYNRDEVRERGADDAPIPGDMAEACMLATTFGCSWVRFDCDAERDDRLPWFEDDEHPLITRVRLERMAEAQCGSQTETPRG